MAMNSQTPNMQDLNGELYLYAQIRIMNKSLIS
jgi:hypothetical protein